MNTTTKMVTRNRKRRQMMDRLMSGFTMVCVGISIIPLLSILGYLIYKGIGSVNWEFLTRLPAPIGATGGGMANSIVGTGIVVGLAALIGVPIGVLAGIYLAEFGRNSWLGKIVRFMADVLQGIPSIIVGIVAYTIVVLPMQRFSAIAGAIALAMMLIPFVARTTEEAMATTPKSIREAGLALGQPHWRVILGIVMRSSRNALVTGIMLAAARVSGETAPLLFTALNNRFWHSGIDQPISTLTVQVYTYATAPFDEWNAQAWAGALVLITLIFILNVVARTAARSKYVERS